jgi:glycosyltransferase involved in cell wall biosynthesis
MKLSEPHTKVVIILSNIDKAIGFEWIVQNIDRSRFDISFILLNDKPSYLATFLDREGIACLELPFSGKKTIPKLILRVGLQLRKLKPHVIHTHLFAANLIGQTAAWVTRIPKRIYTRHSSNENRRYHGKQRWDHYTNRMCTDIVAISENVKDILIREEKVPVEKITLIHHGFDLDRFSAVAVDDVAQLYERYNPGKQSPVIGVIARYSHWKGIQFIIPAFERLLDSYPNALLVLANASRADHADQIKDLLAKLPARSYREIVFEADIFALYQLFDIYVHVPIDPELEAFGQTYVEALAAGIPSIFTLSGVAREFIEDGRNAIVVDFENSDQIYNSMIQLLTNNELREKLAKNGKGDVRKKFSLQTMIEKLQDLYSSKNHVSKS